MSNSFYKHPPQDAWNPDIRSTLPSRYLPLSTMFRPENVDTTIDTANELQGFTGLPIQELIRFRPERLIVHELLIRVSADIFVSDGSRYEDLGVNFRRVVATIKHLLNRAKRHSLYSHLQQEATEQPVVRRTRDVNRFDDVAGPELAVLRRILRVHH